MNRYLIFLLTSHLLFSFAKGDEGTTGGAKRVVCYYSGIMSEYAPRLRPEATDPTLCTHMVYLEPIMNNWNDRSVPVNSAPYEQSGEGYFNRTVMLKELNPRLKVLLHVFGSMFTSVIPSTPSVITEFIGNVVKMLSSNGFDGLHFGLVKPEGEQWLLSQYLKELRKEFDKHDFLISTFIPYDVSVPYDENELDAIKSCSDIIVVKTFINSPDNPNATFIYSSLESVKSTMDMYLANEIPADKLLITIATGTRSFKLKNINENGVGAEIAFDKNGDRVKGEVVAYSKIMQNINDGSGNWTLHRDEESNSAYVTSNTGKWISFDDPINVRMKAAYVIEKNLGGGAIFSLDFDEFEGLVGEERFPLTRALYDGIVRGNEI